MTTNISAFGMSISIIASRTFPNGFTVTQFGHDADPLDQPEITIGESAGNINGDHIVWNKFAPIPVAISVVSGSPDDINLGVLFDANRIAKNKTSAMDTITLAVTYPAGNVITLSDGIIIGGNIVQGASADGKLKTKIYRFNLGNKANTGGTTTS